jgi:hypothetical protein
MFGARRDSLKPSSLQVALRSLRNFSNAGVLVGEFAECRSRPSHKCLFSKINLLEQIPIIYIKSGGIVPGGEEKVFEPYTPLNRTDWDWDWDWDCR